MLFELNDKFVVGYSVPLPEGAEIEILENLVNFPSVFLTEFHSAYNRRRIDELLIDYTLIECSMRGWNYGILKYVRTEICTQN